MDKEAKLYVLFDMLGDLIRSGPLQWKVDRFRTEDLKDHVFDLILMVKLIRPHLPSYIDTEKMTDYAIVHDLAEIITGDITGFEGIPASEKERVTRLATNYLIDVYGDLMHVGELLTAYEEKADIEAKVLKFLDSISSSNTFTKYDNEHKIDMDNPAVIQCLRENPGVLELRKECSTLKEVFYVWHSRKIKFTEEEIKKYNISKEDADRIVLKAKALMASIYEEYAHVDEIIADFPKEAMIYRNVNTIKN